MHCDSRIACPVQTKTGRRRVWFRRETNDRSSWDEKRSLKLETKKRLLDARRNCDSSHRGNRCIYEGVYFFSSFSFFLRELSAGPLIFLGKNRRCLSRVTTRAFLERSPPVKSEPVPFLVRKGRRGTRGRIKKGKKERMEDGRKE